MVKILYGLFILNLKYNNWHDCAFFLWSSTEEEASKFWWTGVGVLHCKFFRGKKGEKNADTWKKIILMLGYGI